MREEMQKRIDQTDYWDMEILDLRISFFGDEVELFIDNDEETCWKLSFLSCWKVLYETDANWRRIINVRDMKEIQLGYYGQDITVSESLTEKFYKIDLDLSIMEMHIECQDILVEKVLKENVDFFWTHN